MGSCSLSQGMIHVTVLRSKFQISPQYSCLFILAVVITHRGPVFWTRLSVQYDTSCFSQLMKKLFLMV